MAPPAVPRRAARFLPPLVWMVVIAVGSSSLLEAGRTATWTRAVLGPLFPGVGPDALELFHGALRKLGHVIEYGALAILWRRALAPAPRATAWAFLLAAGYAMLDELRQGLSPPRTPAATDVGIDAVGALLGLAAWEEQGRLPRLVWGVACGATGLVAGLGVVFLALDWTLGREARALTGATGLLGLAAWAMTRSAAWRRAR